MIFGENTKSVQGDQTRTKCLGTFRITLITAIVTYEIFSILTIYKKFYKDSVQFYGFFTEKEY
jgi:hypothetical protein